MGDFPLCPLTYPSLASSLHSFTHLLLPSSLAIAPLLPRRRHHLIPRRRKHRLPVPLPSSPCSGRRCPVVTLTCSLLRPPSPSPAQASVVVICSGRLFDVMPEKTTVSWNSIIAGYTLHSKWGRIEDARNLFDKMPQKNVVSWNALIAGYGNHGQGIEALELFKQMVRERMTSSVLTDIGLKSCGHSIWLL